MQNCLPLYSHFIKAMCPYVQTNEESTLKPEAGYATDFLSPLNSFWVSQSTLSKICKSPVHRTLEKWVMINAPIK